MELFYLTPASISYLNQFLQAGLITGYLFIHFFIQKKHQPSKLVKLLTAFFASISVFSMLLLLENTFLPAERLVVVYLENTVLGINLVLLIDFAYHFPKPTPKHAYERRAILVLSILYVFWEAGIAIWRFSQLDHFIVKFRPDYIDLLPAALIVWLIFIFLRNTIQNPENHAGRQFAFIFVVPLFIIITNILLSFNYVPALAYHIFASIGILTTLSLFVLNFLSSQPETTPFSTKFSGLIFAVCLAVFGSIAWLIAPLYAESYEPALPDHRTIQFSPNAKGGYAAAEIPFFFDPVRGDDLQLTDSTVNPVKKIDFEFPFFNQIHQAVYVGNDGIIGIGAEAGFREYQMNFTSVPAILPLLVDLDPGASPSGKIYANRKKDSLTITFDHVPAYFRNSETYTFQVVLYSDGKFSISYDGLPKSFTYRPNQNPESEVWAIGIKPENPARVMGSFAALPVEIGSQGLIQDEYQSFRQYQNRIMFPIAATILASSLILLIGVPLIIQRNLARPLNSLLAGVERMNQGDLNVNLPTQFNDEIGYLTQSFNAMSSELNSLIHELESRVSDRTANLLAANRQLLKLTVAVEQSPSTIVITDTNANIEYVNPAFTQSTGYTFEEVKGQNPRILKSELTTDETYQEMWEQLTAGNSWRGELINKKKNGLIYYEYTVITPIRDANGTLTHYAAIKEDVTARVIAEHALRESEKQYRLLFDLETDAILIIRNEDGRILQANHAATLLYGYTINELLKLKNTDLSADPESTKRATNSPLPSDQVLTIPMRYHRKKDNTHFPVEITARFITWQEQSVHIAAIRDITERKKIEEELVKLSITDALTEIPNRRYFYIQAGQVFGHAMHIEPASVLMIDIDHFKNINDAHGHAAGDAILRQIAARLSLNIRPTDILARYGGEEFITLLPRTTAREAEQIAQRLWFVVNSRAFMVEQSEINITISIGIAEASNTKHSLDALIHNADKALYLAKQAGRNRWAVWSPATD